MAALQMIPFKICCIQSEAEADMAINAGAHAIGLVGPMPNGLGPIDDERIRRVAAHVRSRAGRKSWTVLLTSRTGADAICEHVEATGVDTVQIVDAPGAGTYAHLRRALPKLRIIQVIHVEDARAIDQAARAAEDVDALLLDSGKPSAAVRTLGGTGDVHDWSISRRIVEASRAPVFLAGGLNPSNVRGAIAAVRPFGVDVCSGLRRKEHGAPLDREKLAAFAGALSSSGANA
jgi:phosphoribosylanthranilate isomerase